jgi:hypothetical protein
VPPDPRAGRYTGAPAAPNAVYVLDEERGAVRLAQVQGKFFLSLARGHAGAAGQPVVLAGTGPGGRVLSISQEGVVKVLGATRAAQVTAIAQFPDDPGMLLATSNPGGLTFMRGTPSDKGTYTSKPFDAGYLARWGRVWWHQRAGEDDEVRVRLRTGVTAEPDGHWSDWSKWTEEATGAPLELPLGQYAQIQVELSTRDADSPALMDLNVSYKQSNRRPMVRAFNMNGMSVLPPQNGQQGQAQQQRQPNQQPGLVQLDWQVMDPNNDNLVVDLHYRGVDEKRWKEIQEGIREQMNFQWDTNRLPAGHYLLRITASDSAVRGPGEALVEQIVSVPQVIDNRRPRVVELQAERRRDGSYAVTGTARDDYSRLVNLFYSRNGGAWQDAFPEDGLLDSPEEGIVFHTGVLEPGEHVFVVTALDEEHNPGSGKLIINVPED